MIRTVSFACKLPQRSADALNAESGRIYTRVMVEHYRLYRKHGVWLNSAKAERLDDAYHADESALLHAHSIDAAQQGFYKACKTAQANKASALEGAKYPYKRKHYRTTVWKNTAIRLKDKRSRAERKAAQDQPRYTDSQSVLLLSLARGLAPLEVKLPAHLSGLREDALAEMRLVFNKAARHYEWHLVVDDAQVATPVEGSHVVAGDMGEIHPIVLADEQAAAVLSCRELRAARRLSNKKLAHTSRQQSRCTKGSRRWRKLQRRRRRFLAQQERRVRDMLHKVSRAAVSFAQERQASTIALGDVRDIADGKCLNSKSQQKISQWSHGTLREYLTYKANAVGIQVIDNVSEAHTTRTCPNPACRHQYKPKGRVYRCPACGLVAHRDVVGAVNILSRCLHGQVGLLSPPRHIKYRQPYKRRGTHCQGQRSPSDTGQVAGKRTSHRNRGSASRSSLGQNRSHRRKRAAQAAARL